MREVWSHESLSRRTSQLPLFCVWSVTDFLSFWSHCLFASVLLRECYDKEFYLVIMWLFFPPSLGVLQNLRPAVVCLWVSQDLRGDQHLAWEPQKHCRPTMSTNTLWPEFGYKWRNTLITLTLSYGGCSPSQSFYSVRWLFSCRILKCMRLLLSCGI